MRQVDNRTLNESGHMRLVQKYNISKNGDTETMTLFENGTMYTANSHHPRWKEIKDRVKSGRPASELFNLMNLGFSILETVSDAFTYSKGKIFYDNKPLPKFFEKAILDKLNSGTNLTLLAETFLKVNSVWDEEMFEKFDTLMSNADPHNDNILEFDENGNVILYGMAPRGDIGPNGDIQPSYQVNGADFNELLIFDENYHMRRTRIDKKTTSTPVAKEEHSSPYVLSFNVLTRKVRTPLTPQKGAIISIDGAVVDEATLVSFSGSWENHLIGVHPDEENRYAMVGESKRCETMVLHAKNSEAFNPTNYWWGEPFGVFPCSVPLENIVNITPATGEVFVKGFTTLSNPTPAKNFTYHTQPSEVAERSKNDLDRWVKFTAPKMTNVATDEDIEKLLG